MVHHTHQNSLAASNRLVDGLKILFPVRVALLLQEAAEKGERQSVGRPEKTLHDGRFLPTVKDLGSDWHDSHRFQLLATIPEAKYEEALERTSSRAALLM